MLDHKSYHLEGELCFATYSALKGYNKFYSEALKPYHLTYPQYITLLILWEEKRPMMIKELGASLGLDTGTLIPLFYRMEDNGWITRQRSHKDSRQVYLELISKAKKEEKEIKNSVSACFKVIDMTSLEYKKLLIF